MNENIGSAGDVFDKISQGITENELWKEIYDYFKEGSEQSCELLGLFGIVLQMILFFVSFSTLLIKRKIEKPQRPWKIFFLDTSKQVFSAGMLHCYNILYAEFLAKGDNVQCQWYFINFSIDIIGIAGFCYLLLLAFNKILKKWDIIIEEGDYGFKEENTDERIHITKDSKLCIVLVIIAFKESWLYLGILILYPISKYPRLLLFVVMIVIPIAFNAIQFWILDNILKKKTPKKLEKGEQAEPDENKAEDLNTYDDDGEYEKKKLVKSPRANGLNQSEQGKKEDYGSIKTD